MAADGLLVPSRCRRRISILSLFRHGMGVDQGRESSLGYRGDLN